MNRVIEVKDVLDSAAKYGKDAVLHFDPTKFRDNKSKNKQAKFDCTWVDIQFKHANGEKVPLRVKFTKVLTASAAKISDSVEENASVKNMLIAFREFKKEEVLAGDYAPKEKENEEEQVVEKEKCEKNVEAYCLATKQFNDALEIIDMSYHEICDDIKGAGSLGFKIRKASTFKTNKDVPVFSIRQTIRKDKDNDDEEIPLQYPITRLKLSVNKETGKVGIDMYNRDTRNFVFAPNVYDSRKMTASNSYKAVLAKVKEGNALKDLDIRNAGSFITYKSLIGGIVEFPEIIVSKFGFSLSSRFRELYVRRYKKSESESVFSNDDIKGLNEGCEENESDSDVELKTDKPSSPVENEIGKDDDISDLDDKASDDSLENNDEADDVVSGGEQDSDLE